MAIKSFSARDIFNSPVLRHYIIIAEILSYIIALLCCSVRPVGMIISNQLSYFERGYTVVLFLFHTGKFCSIERAEKPCQNFGVHAEGTGVRRKQREKLCVPRSSALPARPDDHRSDGREPQG